MPALGLLLVLLVCSPLVIFVLHGAAHRVLDRAGRSPSAHRSALVAIALGFVALLAAVWALDLVATTSWGEAAATLAYVAAVYGVIAVLYLDVVNIAETSLHMHLLLQVAWSGPLDIEGLLERYSASRMIASRLERLASIGQLRVEAGHAHLADRSTLRFNALLDVWRRVLGLPTEPDEQGPHA
ncbi:MAG: hypothetical protein Q8L86_16355 [Vicinamibacterales bacterium]|nr:hypothetical protein [Vicinamibacterales bacterium]